nr:cleavage/polyadenylation specificity factor, 25kDa subunit [Tanacetum cinerariifolium]
TGTADQMWNTLAHAIKDATKDSLGVTSESVRTQSTHRESWWYTEEVQTKVAAKQARLKELPSCREGTQEDIDTAKERAFPSEACSSQHRLRLLKSRSLKKLSALEEDMLTGTADQMWNTLAHAIKDATKDSLATKADTTQVPGSDLADGIGTSLACGVVPNRQKFTARRKVPNRQKKESYPDQTQQM